MITIQKKVTFDLCKRLWSDDYYIYQGKHKLYERFKQRETVCWFLNSLTIADQIIFLKWMLDK